MSTMSNGHAEDGREAQHLATLLDAKRASGHCNLSKDEARRVQRALESAESAHELLAGEPDAPRAGGETPDIAAIFATVSAEDLALVEHLERCTHMHVTSTEHDQVNAWADRRNRARVLLLQRMAALLARHRDGERDTRLLDWLTASCRDLIHSEGGKWEVIEYPGDPLVEERRAIGNTPRKALIAAGALRVAHPYDAISASPPAASPEPFPALDDKKLSRAIDLDIEALDGCETLDERLTIARHLVALCEESARRSASVPPAASEPTEGASNAPNPRTPAPPSPERASHD